MAAPWEFRLRRVLLAETPGFRGSWGSAPSQPTGEREQVHRPGQTHALPSHSASGQNRVTQGRLVGCPCACRAGRACTRRRGRDRGRESVAG